MSVWSHKVILDGFCKVESRGFRNITTLDDVNITEWNATETNATLEYGIYKVNVSLFNQINAAYGFDENSSAYYIHVTCPDANDSIYKVADLLGVDVNVSLIEQEDLTIYPGWNLIATPFEGASSLDMNLSGYRFTNSSWEYLLNVDEVYSGEGLWVLNRFDEVYSTYLKGESRGGCPNFAELTPGWHLLGSCEIENISDIFTENPNIVIVYKFSNGHWEAIGGNGALNRAIFDSGVANIFSISPTDGFWVYVE
jgi:hypothetical protein